jgi:hypothetical protein
LIRFFTDFCGAKQYALEHDAPFLEVLGAVRPAAPARRANLKRQTWMARARALRHRLRPQRI